jgi:DNA-directed RNA polymerase I subunit RPA12
VTQS